jgi:glycerol-3-phosphate dehydrogenase
MAVTQNRLTQRVINRLRKATDGDILVPGGTVSILGTTSVRVESPDRVYPEIDEIDRIIDEGSQMIPGLETTHYVRAYCGVRPLVLANDTENDRNVSRGFALIDHAPHGIENFITITGGKLTTYRLMAEKTADLICDRLGVSQPCRTHIEPLPRSEETRWTTPGSAPRHWVKGKIPGEHLMCECEMVPQSVIESIISSIRRQNIRPGLSAIGLRSRIGRGPCQGIFCSLIISAFLYDKKEYVDNQGLVSLCDFLNERWRGLKPLQWDFSLVKSELREALHCGFLGLESDSNYSVGVDP